jgi:hypothetical protein
VVTRGEELGVVVGQASIPRPHGFQGPDARARAHQLRGEQRGQNDQHRREPGCDQGRRDGVGHGLRNVAQQCQRFADQLRTAVVGSFGDAPDDIVRLLAIERLQRQPQDLLLRRLLQITAGRDAQGLARIRLQRVRQTGGGEDRCHRDEPHPGSPRMNTHQGVDRAMDREEVGRDQGGLHARERRPGGKGQGCRARDVPHEPGEVPERGRWPLAHRGRTHGRHHRPPSGDRACTRLSSRQRPLREALCFGSLGIPGRRPPPGRAPGATAQAGRGRHQRRTAFVGIWHIRLLLTLQAGTNASGQDTRRKGTGRLLVSSAAEHALVKRHHPHHAVHRSAPGSIGRSASIART